MTDQNDEFSNPDDEKADDGEADSDHEVGFGKPPKETRFKPGQSGNPKGRPQGSKEARILLSGRDSLAKMVLQIGRRKIKVNDADGPIEIDTVEAIVRSLAVSALKGNTRAQSKFLDMTTAIEAKQQREREEAFVAVLDYKNRMEAAIAQGKAEGQTDFSDIIPHPDHIHIDPRLGTAELLGPMTAEEKKIWDKYRAMKEDLESRLPEMAVETEEEEDPEIRRLMLEDNESIKDLLKMIDEFLSTPSSLIPHSGPSRRELTQAMRQKPKSKRSK